MRAKLMALRKPLEAVMSEAQLVIVVLMLLIMFFSFSLVVVVAVVSARGTLEVISKVFKKFADTLGSKR